jgi:two-component sensor histidine kinase
MSILQNKFQKVSKYFPRLAWQQNWSISTKFTHVVFLFSLVPAVLSESRGLKVSRIYQFTALEKFYLWLFFIAFIISAKKLIKVLRNGKSSLFLVTSIGFFAGLATGILDVKLQKFLGLTMNESYRFSAVSSFALTGALWLPIGSALTQGPKELRRRKAELLAQAEKIHRVQLRQNIAFSAIQERINTDLRHRMHSTVENLKDLAPKFDLFNKKPDLALYLSKEITQWNLMAIQTMRDLSHKIATPVPTYPKTFIPRMERYSRRILSIIDAFSTSLKTKPVSPYLFTAMTGSTIAYPILREQEMLVGLWRFAVIIGIIFTIEAIVFLIRLSYFKDKWQVDILGLILIIALPWMIKLFSDVGNSDQTIYFKNIIFGFMVVFVFAIIHISQSYLISGEEIVRSISNLNTESLAKEKVVSEQLSILSQGWSEHIHGRVVSQLASASMLLEQVESKGDTAAIISALEIIANALMDPDLGPTEAAPKKNLEEEINFRLDPWKGILDLQLSIDPKSKIVKTNRLSEIGLLVEEAISNSVRHGKSSQIEVSIPAPELGKLTLWVKDNSEVPLPADFPVLESTGMGLKIYDSVTDGNWNIKNDPTNKSSVLWAEVSLV